MQPPKNSTTQPNTAPRSRTEYERERDARESADMAQAVERLWAEKQAAQLDNQITWEPGDGAQIIAYAVYTYDGIDYVSRRPYYQKNVLNAYEAGYNVPTWWTPPANAVHPNRTPIKINATTSPVDSVLANLPEQNEPTSVTAGDGELARIAVGLKQGREIQLWLAIREAVRSAGGKDYVLKRDLPALLALHHVKCSTRNLDRWLSHGDGVYWTVTRNRIRITGYRKLSKKLTIHAHEIGLPELVTTNRPGMVRPMYINLASKTLAEFEANVYAAWFASRNDPAIRRETLKKLFNRDLKVLLEWETTAGIEVVPRYGHITAEFSDRIPKNEQGEFREDVHEYQFEGGNRWKVRLSNMYRTKSIRQHPKRGQGRRVAREILDLLESDNPAGINAQGDEAFITGGLERLDRQYFEDSAKTTAAAKAKDAFNRGKQGDKWLYLGSSQSNQLQFILATDGIQRAALDECLPRHAGSVNYV